MTDRQRPVSALVDPAILAGWGRSPEAVELAASVLGAPLAYHLLHERIDDVSQLDSLRSAAFIRALGNRKRLERGVELCADLESSGLSCLPIKGLANASSLWPQPELRPCGDIDVLVRPQDLDRVMEWFSDRGFRFVVKPFVLGVTAAERLLMVAKVLLVRRGGAYFSIVAPDGGLAIDLHTHVESNPVPQGLQTDEVLAASRLCTTPVGTLRTPAPHHAFMIAALHAHRSYYDACEVKSVLDALLLLRRYPEEIVANVPDLARRGGMSRRVGFFVELIRTLAKGDVPAGLPDPPRTVERGTLREAVANVTLASVKRRSVVGCMGQIVQQDFVLADSWSDYARLYLGRLGEPRRTPWEAELARRPQ